MEAANEDPRQAGSEQIIHARIELHTKEGGFLTANIEAVDDPENRAVVFVEFIRRHLQSLTDMAMREHQERQAGKDSAQIVTDVVPRLAGPDGSLVN
jgi:hypothetical protein